VTPYIDCIHFYYYIYYLFKISCSSKRNSTLSRATTKYNFSGMRSTTLEETRYYRIRERYILFCSCTLRDRTCKIFAYRNTNRSNNFVQRTIAFEESHDSCVRCFSCSNSGAFNFRIHDAVLWNIANVIYGIFEYEIYNVTRFSMWIWNKYLWIVKYKLTN